LAAAGHDVTVLERLETPSLLARGDLLVPGAVWELGELGIDVAGSAAHTVLGSRLWHGDRSVAVRWPQSPGHHDSGVVWNRTDLDQRLRERATAAGADVRLGAVATTPIVERGFVRGATVQLSDGSTQEIGCRFLVVADGANSRFGRVLGTNRLREWPYAVSCSTYVTSQRTSESWVETNLGILDARGHPVTGHGWVHPVGDGTLNVGVTILSSYRDVLGVNVVKLLDSFCATAAARWQFDPEERLVEPLRWRTPLGGSISPKMGPTFLVTGDAAGMANPFNSHGMRSAFATARIAADVLDEALTVGNSTTLQQYPARLDTSLGQYYKVARLTARFLGRPLLLRSALAAGFRSEAIMGAALRIGTNELREIDRGGAERLYRLAAVVAKFAPSW
jgi:menaquinone-9 beta-reductase